MKRAFLTAPLLFAAHLVWCQCNMSITNMTLTPWPTCDNFLTTIIMGVRGSAVGGTAPLTVTGDISGFPGTTSFTPIGVDVNYGCPNQCNGWWTGPLGGHLHVVDALGCVADGYTPNTMSYSFDRLFHVPGALGTNMFNIQVEAVDCAGGIFRMRLTDNAAEVGDAITGQGMNYTLTRNGTTLESGSMTAKYVSSPSSLVFNNLTPGVYLLNITNDISSPSSQQVEYCPGACTVRFVVPDAGDCGTNVSVQAQLSTTSDALRVAGLLPTTEPYSALGYTYVGTAPGGSVTAGLFNVTGNDAVVDWVVVEARTTETPSQVVASAPALLQLDGDVVALTGKPYVTLPIAAGNYRIAIRHRNHLALMTSQAHPLGVFCGIDLRNAFVGTTSTLHSLVRGDGNGDGVVKYTGSGNDRDPILLRVGNTTPNNVVSNVYERLDINLDGSIRYTGANNDRDPILTAVGSTTPTNTVQQSLP